MHTAAVLGSAISLASLAAARIIGFSAPATVGVDSQVTLTILSENYIQSVQDVSISFGIWPTNTSYPSTLGTFLSTRPIGPDDSNTLYNLTHYTRIPSDTPKGPATLTAALFSFYGARYSGQLTYFTVHVTVADRTDLSGFVTNSTG